MDAGKFSHTLVIRPQHQPDKTLSFPTTRSGFDAAVAFIRHQVPAATAERIPVGIEFAGNYGFTCAHYLAQLGFPTVSVLPAHTKRRKDVAHNQPLKTDAKDAATITDLLAQGHSVSFPFLSPAYADLRYLVTARERLSLLRRSAITQLRTLIQVVFPEFEALFPLVTKKTPFTLLRTFPTPQDLLDVSKATRMPPLADRFEDIGLLALRFLEECRTETRGAGPSRFDPQVLTALELQPFWLANVCQLRAVVRLAFTEAMDEETIRLEVLVLDEPASRVFDPSASSAQNRRLVQWPLWHSRGHITKASKLIGAHR